MEPPGKRVSQDRGDALVNTVALTISVLAVLFAFYALFFAMRSSDLIDQRMDLMRKDINNSFAMRDQRFSDAGQSRRAAQDELNRRILLVSAQLGTLESQYRDDHADKQPG